MHLLRQQLQMLLVVMYQEISDQLDIIYICFGLKKGNYSHLITRSHVKTRFPEMRLYQHMNETDPPQFGGDYHHICRDLVQFRILKSKIV